jgi:hypothetical protein
MTNINLDLDFFRRNEGYIYGKGATLLAEQVARAVAAAKPTSRSRAVAAGKVLRAAAKAAGHKPAIEVHLARGERGKGWVASYEAGPHEWAIVATDALSQLDMPGEAYWSFDLWFH